MTTAWATLPNAALIDKVMTSLQTEPQKWSAAWHAAQDAAWHAAQDAAWHAARDAAWHAARDAAWHAAQDAAWHAAQDAARDAARGAAWHAAWHTARDAARDAVWSAARGALTALVAYDDAGQFLKTSPDLLVVMHRLDPHPMYLLLLPAAFVFAEVSS
jgi:hypothetical protein